MVVNTRASFVDTKQSVASQRTGRPGKMGRALARATRERKIEHVKQQNLASSPLDIITNDLNYLQESTGLDFRTTLAPVRDVHDQVAAVLNPLARERITEELQEEILQLQQGLQKAHDEVHALEDQLSDTIGYLSSLERTSNTLQDALDNSAHMLPAQQSERESPPSGNSPNPQVSQRKSRSLHSSLDIPDTLRNFWYPVEFSSRLTKIRRRSFEMFNEPWEISRNSDGSATCQPDLADPRSEALLSRSRPSIVEQDGFVYLWTGNELPNEMPELVTRPPDGFTIHSELELDVPVEHGLLLENLLDLAHAPFTHTTTFAKGWPVPDVVKFNAARMLGGNWEPYPIDMSFDPPCMVNSTIGLAQPGKIERGLRASACRKHLHQLHVCLPAGTGRTRLLYRMSMDFLGWTKFVPYIQNFWANIAKQVLGEDLVLVKGQQERMLSGANVWANPVSYDKLGVRYRRWRNTLSSGTKAEQREARKDLVPMRAGEVFSLEQS